MGWRASKGDMLKKDKKKRCRQIICTGWGLMMIKLLCRLSSPSQNIEINKNVVKSSPMCTSIQSWKLNRAGYLGHRKIKKTEKVKEVQCVLLIWFVVFCCGSCHLLFGLCHFFDSPSESKFLTLSRRLKYFESAFSAAKGKRFFSSIKVSVVAFRAFSKLIKVKFALENFGNK